MLELSAEQDYDYFNNIDIANLIGSVPETISNYHLFATNSSGTVQEMATPTSVFVREDLYQDVDAFNLYRLYDFSDITLDQALYDYYYISEYYKQRFTIFKRELVSEYESSSFYEIVYRVANEEIPVLSAIFDIGLASFSSEKYEASLAEGFVFKIEALISEENSGSSDI